MELEISHKEILKADRNYEESASLAKLVYVNTSDPGIIRLKKGKSFQYTFMNKPVRDKKKLDRIRKLVLPPAWTDVWICPSPHGHIQATGLDARRRKQYRYHELWNQFRKETKFHKLYEFGKTLPNIRAKVERDISQKNLTREKVLATVVSLMEHTGIRVGNAEYEKANGSHGLTTLKDKHAKISGDKLTLSFVGKKGILHNITLKSKRLARIVSQCRDIPGKELFQYIDENGERKSIDSGMVNEYIREACGKDFTAKDFRTWSGTLQALMEFSALNANVEAPSTRKNVNVVLDCVSRKLGNSRTICKKYYVHPALIQLYEEDKLNSYLTQYKNGSTPTSIYEEILLKILKSSI
ncbi:MAG: DNA topoisomerase I [Bacteroidetes bacterium]|nr:MAG: DNA topoisomerase I [Bacteroidota bacterium]